MSSLAHNLHEIISRGVQLHSGNYDQVLVAASELGDIQHNPTGETFTLWVNYDKGDEDGVNFWVVFYENVNPPAIGGRESAWEAIGAGVLLHSPRSYRFEASKSWIPIAVDTDATYRYFRVYQQVQGSTAPTGRVKCVAEIHKIAR